MLEEKENQDGKREIKQLGIGFYATSRVPLGIVKVLILKKGKIIDITLYIMNLKNAKL